MLILSNPLTYLPFQKPHSLLSLVYCRTPTPLLSHFSLHLNTWCTKRWQGIPKTFADYVTIQPSWSDLSILFRQKNAKWNDPPNIWFWCLSDPQPCSSSFSWSLLPLGLTFLRYENISDLLFFADRHKTTPHYWTLRTPYFASWEASLSCRVPVFPNRLGPLAPSKGFGIATWICCFHLLPKQNAALM